MSLPLQLPTHLLRRIASERSTHPSFKSPANLFAKHVYLASTPRLHSTLSPHPQNRSLHRYNRNNTRGVVPLMSTDASATIKLDEGTEQSGKPEKRQRQPRGPMSADTRLSKALTYTLRHGAEKEKIKMGDDGYVNVGELLSHNRYKTLKLDFPTLQRIVRSCEKQRFSLAPLPSASPDSTNPNDYQIRATQGHSLSITLSLTPILSPGLLIHGTFYCFYESILASNGLKRMARQHIHFSYLDRYLAGLAKSGMRKDAEVLVIVDGDRAVKENGLSFWESENGVVLTEGDDTGTLSLEWVVKICEKGERGELGDVLWEGGEKKKEVDMAKAKRVPRGKERVGKDGGGKGKKSMGKRIRGDNEKLEGGDVKKNGE